MQLKNLFHNNAKTILPFKRVCLKLSGEALMGSATFGLDPTIVTRIAAEIKQVHDAGIQLCIVIGGGNIFRGVMGANQGMDRTLSDSMGMLATVINALALKNSLEHLGIEARVQSAIPMETVCEPYIHRRALSHLSKNRVVIFAAGTGSPYFTTDTTAALRAAEMKCDALFKGTKVDGIYSADPYKDPAATRYDHLTYEKVIHDQLNVMDMTAIALARDTQLPVIVFSIAEPGNFLSCIQGEGNCTLVNMA
jgi:uridylate kinase